MTMKRRLMIMVGIIAIMIAMLLWCGSAMADSGTIDGMDWDLTDGVLTLGTDGETQTLNGGATGWNYWPWDGNRSSITAVVSKGELIFRGSLRHMFYNCINLTSLDASSWNVSSVTVMASMFQHCQNLVSLDVSGWNTSNVVTMYQMFDQCKTLPLLDLSGFDTSSVTDMQSLFSNCNNLASLNISGWDTSKVTNMSSMFYNCYKLTEVDVSSFDTSLVTNMSNMFYGCWFSTLDVSHWNTGNVTTMSRMFYNNQNLQSLDVSHWDVSKVRDMSYMFYICTKLSDLDVSAWNTSSLSNMICMFYSCGKLRTLNVSDWDVSHVTDMYFLFRSCGVESLDLSKWDVSHVTRMESLFHDCIYLVSLNITDWNTSNVTNMSSMFSGCSALVNLDVTDLDTENVITMACMFYNCSNLTNLDVSGFSTSKVTAMNGMFYHCDNLEEIDVSGFDTSNVIENYCMFFQCIKLKKLDLSNWNLSKCTHMSNDVFQACNSLAEVILGDHNPFIGDVEHPYNNNIAYAYMPLPTPLPNVNGVAYTGKWVREDGTAGPYTPTELCDNYTFAMAGKWVWEKVPTEYIITFVCIEDDYLGEMSQVTVEASENYTLPGNAFRVFGYEFDHWMDSTGRIYMDGDTIPANTYAVNAEVTLTAVFGPRDTFIIMQDGAFDFSIKADEKALFSPVPASTAYQVYEQTPFGWNLIMQTDASGVIVPDAESEALFLNKYDPLKVTVRFAGTKLMDGAAAEVDSFNFLLYEDDTLVDIASVGDGGLIEFQPITYEQAGIHHYYIREAVGDDVTVSYDIHVEEITVEITSDGAGHLYADVVMDEDEILFENVSKPGYLALSKANAGNDSGMGTFWYEIQFTTENGQPYELFSGDITYEERDEEISELPIGQPIEKPKYRLGIGHYGKTDGVNPRLIINSWEDHEAGEVVTLRAASMGTGNSSIKYRLESVDSGFVKTTDGSWKGLMPAHNMDVKLIYGQYVDPSVRVSWNMSSQATPMDVVAILYANGIQVAECDRVHVGETYRFENYPAYDAEGALIEYTIEVMAEDGYAVWPYGPGSSGYVYNYYYNIAPGLNGKIIWDDMDNYYEMRPDNVMVMCTLPAIHSSTAHPVYAYDDWKFYFSSNYSLTDYPATLTITSANMPAGYTLITSEDDSTLDKYDLKLKLVSIPTAGAIVWDDNDNSAGKRPDSVVVHIMDGTLDIDQMVVDDANDWAFVLAYPVPLHGGPLTYTIRVEEVEDYTASIDGTTVTMTQMSMVDITVTDVTLLSASEYNTYRSQIPSVSAYWWLRGPGSWWSTSMYVPSNVMPDGSVEIFYASNGNFGIRPVLVCDLNGTGLEIGNKLRFVGYDWTVISDSLVLCDSCVGNSPFGPGNTWVKLQSETLTTPYDDSYTKTWVENWATEKGIMPEKQFEITDVTLLAVNEYTTNQENIPLNAEQQWWLRTKNEYSSDNAYYVTNEGAIHSHMVNWSKGVRPLIVCDLTDCDYQIGNKVELVGYQWTVLNDTLVLCDDFVGLSPFRTNNQASDAVDYEASDVKQWLANWVATHPFWTKTVTATVIQ